MASDGRAAPLPAGPDRPIVLVSNRGPVAFAEGAHGELNPARGAGGLVSGLAPLVTGTGCTWIAAAMSDGDRLAAERGPIDADGFRIHLVAPPPDRYRLAYDVVANATLWYLHHHLWDLARRPRFSAHFADAWEAFRSVNQAFAEAVVDSAPDGSVVLAQDYHLSLMAPAVRAARPDLTLVHFAHTPFASPDMSRVLPPAIRHELFAGLAANHACGFHTPRWADTFAHACTDTLGAAPATFVAPLAPDPADLAAAAAKAETAAARAELASIVGDRKLIVRVDRIELSKNLVRGFLAYDELLAGHPEWRERVVFGAFVYPSRERLPDYLAYRQEVDAVVAQINARWATPGWTPIHHDATDSYPRSVAALQSYDVLLVNPIRDGLNLVAKEGPLLNERDGVLLLSPEAGAWQELAAAAIEVHPFDIGGTAYALHEALSLDADDRRRRATHLRALVAARTPADWLADQLAAAAGAVV